jgi:hypothetical protein
VASHRGDRPGVGRISGADLLAELPGELGDRAVALDLRDDRRRPYDPVVPVGVVTSHHPDRPPGERADLPAEPSGVGVAGVHVRDVRAHLPNEPRELPGLQVVQASVGDETVDLGRRDDDRPELPDLAKGLVDLGSTGCREGLRIPRAGPPQLVEAVPADEKSPDDERAEDAPATRFIDAEDPFGARTPSPRTRGRSTH